MTKSTPAVVIPNTHLKLLSRSDVLTKPCPVPKEPGIYGWFFTEVPGSMNTDRCLQLGSATLLYIGISPQRPALNGRPTRASRNLQARIRYHYTGNASGSTLRTSLGCLLANRLKIHLQPIGSGASLSFGDGEDLLDHWMAEHAYVTWHETPEPWIIEDALIKTLDLPLNLEGNAHNSFFSELTEIRRMEKAKGRLRSTRPSRVSRARGSRPAVGRL